MSADHIGDCWVFTVPIVQKASGVNVDQHMEKKTERGVRLTWPNATSVRDMQGIKQEQASNWE